MGRFDRLKRLFGGPAAHRPAGDSPGRDPANAGASEVRFIPAARNPFGIEVWDCAEFTQSRIALTTDPEIAMRFTRLRSSSGSEYRSRMPRNASSFACRMTYPLSREFAEGPLFKAEAMEDKWDVYCFDPHLYFVRSWTGELEYRAAIRMGGDHPAITRVESAGGRDADFSIRTVDYLVKSHLFNVVVPHPLPSELPAVPMQIAAWSFSTFGRRCALGTCADPTGLPRGARE